MKSNFEYLKEFVKKHNYSEQIHVQCYKSIGIDSIKTVVFDEKDIPSKRKIRIEDIRYDIDTSLPEDVFYRWLEYLNEDENNDVTYIYWMTQMDNHYEPMGIDKSSSERVRKKIYDKLEEIKNMRWF